MNRPYAKPPILSHTQQVPFRKSQLLHSERKGGSGYAKEICHAAKRFKFVWRVFFAQYLHVFTQPEDVHSLLHGIFWQKDCRAQSIRLTLRPIRDLFAQFAGSEVIAQRSALHPVGIGGQSTSRLITASHILHDAMIAYLIRDD